MLSYLFTVEKTSDFTPVWITVHPISITFAESVFGTLLGGFSFGLALSRDIL